MLVFSSHDNTKSFAPLRLILPTTRVQIENRRSLFAELQIEWKDPVFVLPRLDRVPVKCPPNCTFAIWPNRRLFVNQQDGSVALPALNKYGSPPNGDASGLHKLLGKCTENGSRSGHGIPSLRVKKQT